ncbi:MAG: DUF1963 domain-containing protein [Planctomycetia bacterium]|nr:DUF1963 domain-containing protein [Planctomycetia bacterium]
MPFPELAAKAATSIRLHPRYGEEPAVDASKIGGTFLWPLEEPWPTCSAHGIPLVTVLQLRAADFPEMPFPSGTDLFQVLWCPREHDDVPECRDKPCPMFWADPQFYWRSRQEITRSRPDNPLPLEAYYEYVPFPCQLLPERVVEYPSVRELPEDFVQRIYEWQARTLAPNGTHAFEYEPELSVACGTKIGGYLNWIQDPWIPTCDCGKLMEHLLTIASMEWNGIIGRWTPVEEQEILNSSSGTWDEWTDETWDEWADDRKALQSALWSPTGLMLGDAGHMQLFVCRHCGKWPIVANIECC